MKKKILLITLVAALLASACSCGNTSETEDAGAEQGDDTTEAVQLEDGDYMVNHIKSLSPENRYEFLYFWQAAISYCKIIRLELEEINNTEFYEFDPTDETQIPFEIKDECDFLMIRDDNYENLHKDFKLTIDGTDVSLSFDGLYIYPTEYGYSDIMEIVDTLNAQGE